MANNGGFKGYRKLSGDNNSGLKLSVSSDVKTKQASAEKNQKAAAEDTECIVREQDMFMPIANVIRIMRKILPPHAKISDDAKETIQECVSEYISFITGEANERCQREQRKTITAEDVLWAMSKLGFDDYVEPLTMYLHRYRELEGDRTSMRSEALGKRSAADFSALSGVATGFVPPQFHPNGYFGPPMGTFLWEAPNNNNNNNAAASSSSSARKHGTSNAEPKGRSM